MSHEKSDPTHCPDCALGDFARNHYFTGKLLVERDFTDEQRFNIDKLRHHHQRLHGWGVVCGLKVKEHPTPSAQADCLIVEPGTAIDCCGHEILVRTEVPFHFSGASALKALRAQQPPDTNPHTLQICIRYKECPTEDIPVLFDECGCDETRCAPNRILESYELDVLVDPPQTASDHEQVSLKWTNTTPLAHSTKLALHDATQRLYVMSSDTPAVIHAISTSNHTIIASANLPAKGLALAVSTDGKQLYAAIEGINPGGTPQVLTLDTNNLAATPIVLAVTGAAGNPTTLAVTSDNRLFALFTPSGHLSIWDDPGTPSDPDTVIQISVGVNDLIFSTDGTHAYSADAANQNVAMVDISVSPVVGTSVAIEPGAAPSMLAIAHSTAGDTLVVGDDTNQKLYLVTLDGTNAITSLALTHTPVAVLASPGGSSIFVLERDGATAERFYIEPINVHRVQLSEPQPLGPLTQVGDNAAQLALSESGGTLYVAYDGDPAAADSGGVAIIEVTEENCAELLWQGLDGCPSCDTGNCVVLATIESYHLGDKIEDQSDPAADPTADLAAQIARIDNRKGRQLLPSTQVLTHVVKCLLEHTDTGGEGKQGPPGPAGPAGATGPKGDPGDPGIALNLKLPHIVAINWPHNGVVTISNTDPVYQLIASSGLIVAFDQEMIPDSIEEVPNGVDQVSPIFEVLMHDEPKRGGSELGLPAPTVPTPPQSGGFLRCYCPIPAQVNAVRVVTDAMTDANQEVPSCGESILDVGPLDKTPGANQTATGAQFVAPPHGSFEGGLPLPAGDYRVIVRGDFILAANPQADGTVNAALDANHIGRGLPLRCPTGDGIQGGTFESWFRVEKPTDPTVHDVNLASRTALVAVKGIGPAMAKKIEAERRKRPFSDIADFRARVKPTRQEWKLMKDSVSVMPSPFR